VLRIRENRHALELRQRLFEEFHPLADEFERQERHAGEIMPGTRKTVD
jgi:hypothetical protein